MNIFKKLKSIFLDTEQEEKEEKKAAEGIVQPPLPIIQPKGNIINECALCSQGIGTEDNVREFNNGTVHKRCFKKATKAYLQGKNLDEVFK